MVTNISDKTHNTKVNQVANDDAATADTALMTLHCVSYMLDESGTTHHHRKLSPFRIQKTSHHKSSHQKTRLQKKGWLTGARSAKHDPYPETKKATTSDSQRRLLSNINLQVLPYEKISVIGPNGAGKSTLMKLMLGLIDPTSGKIIRHTDLNIGYVPQKFNVPTILPLRVKDLLSQSANKLYEEQQTALFKRLSIKPLLDKQVIYLSGGETQRVLLARSLLIKPNLLILDEPMQGLDPESERWLYEFIDDLPSFLQCAMVVVSHDLHWVMRGSRRVICLNKHICCEGQPSDLEVSEEFKKLFGHQYEQPYIHKHHDCQHHEPHSL